MNARFKKFQQRYNQIIEAEQNQSTNHDKLKAFILSKTNKINSILPIESNNFIFSFDNEKQKLIIDMTFTICNLDASNILHYFRQYDDQAIWYLSEANATTTKRTFVLNLEKIGDKLLDDFESYLANPNRNNDEEASIINRNKNYIPAEKGLVSKNDNQNTVNKSSNAYTIGKFAGLFALTIGVGVAAYQLLPNSDAIQENIWNYKK